MKKQGIIFDMDGTLWDSAANVAESWNEAIRQDGRLNKALTETDIKGVMGKTMDVIAKLLFPEISEKEQETLLAECCRIENDYLREHGGVLYPDLFPKGYATWQTVYVTGLDNTWGSVMDNGLKLDFYGTVKNDNIIVCGLNLAYYYGVSADKSVGRLLSDMMDITSAQLPERTNIELKVEHDVNGITITSDYDNVNTSLSYHDIFVSDEWLGKKNNLTYVRAGVTKIMFKIPYLWQGLCVSVAGLILSVVWVVVLAGFNKKHQVEEIREDLNEDI